MGRGIWAVGDSITQGNPLNQGPSWRPYVMNRRTTWLAVGTRTDWIGLRHDGWSGYTSGTMNGVINGFFATVTAQATPTDVVVWLGANDALTSVPAATWKANMEAIAAKIAANYPSANRWVIKLPPSTGPVIQASYDSYNAYITAGTLVGYTGVIDLSTQVYPSAALLDAVHFTPTGDFQNALVMLTAMGPG